ncbi:glycoside hydrolase family 16 protein [Occallatibacter riparius]|uniref:Glycoside hydrolase family 16 protein n=1 Tax=Occallatibacter riparius TaxID=1002689 RepID=A0A9J7BR63_9BACT|nr:glycoside hydrolase family 16 protein [Occallatibacter riparius]UWZ85315.1 glycoside hydrolase family 16 protein [Occallatibacter riparius]
MKNLSRTVLGCAVASILLAASRPAQAQCGTTGATGTISWATQWCDEFNGAANSAISSANWTYDTGAGGWGNKELETYCSPTSNTSPCSTSTPNAYMDGSGHLAIKVYSVGSAYTSARLKSQGLQTFHSGRIEASIEIPSHAGLWPAFWMLGSQSGVSWPTVGESDIVENWPTTSNIAGPGATGNRSTIHTKVTGGSGLGGAYTFPSGQAVNSAFHTYGQIWSANMIQFYVDDATKPFYVVTASDLPAGDIWPFSSSADSFFIIMNMAVGGTLGAPTDSATGTQSPMLVDYVRQYVPSPIPAPTLSPNGNITLKAGATTGNSTTLTVQNTLGTGRVAFSCTTTAPKASCIVTSADPLNKHTVDFSNASSDSAAVTVTTTANTQHGGHANGTAPGTYSVTVNAFTESSSDATKPSSSASFTLTVN